MLRHIIYRQSCHSIDLISYHTMSKSITSFFTLNSTKKRKLDTTTPITTTATCNTAANNCNTTHTSTSSIDSPNKSLSGYDELEQSIPTLWLPYLQSEFNQPYWNKLKSFLMSENNKHTIYPPKQHVFRALQYYSPGGIKVVIVGQDPYHGHGQAEGMLYGIIPISVSSIQ